MDRRVVFILLCFKILSIEGTPPALGSDIRLAGGLTDNEITLMWNKPTSGSFTKYIISVTPNTGVSQHPAVVSTADSTPTLRLSGLTPSTQYTVSVKTGDASGGEGPAKTYSAKTLPPRVSTVKVSDIQMRSAKVSWDKPPSGAFDNYVIECWSSCTPDRTTVPADEANPNVLLVGLVPGGHTAGTAYSVAVYTVKDGTKSPRIDNARHFVTRPAGVDADSVTITRVDAISATVKWSKVTEGQASQFVITLQPSAEFHSTGGEYLVNPDGPPPQLDLRWLTPSTEYNVTIQTQRSGMWGDAVTKFFTTAKADIKVTSKAPTEAIATWEKSSGSFDYYGIRLNVGHASDRARTGPEIITPRTVPMSTAAPEVKLTKLTSGERYRLDVWTVKGTTLGLTRSSEWFKTAEGDRSAAGGGSSAEGGSKAVGCSLTCMLITFFLSFVAVERILE